MPSTHPSGTWLARCWVRHPSTLSFGKSFSHSNGVNSARADWVDMLVSASLLSHKGVTSPWGWPTGRVNYMGDLHITAWVLDLIWGHTICDLVYYLIFHFTPMVFHLPFPLKCVSFLQHYVSQHQLNCASSFIIIALLSVCFTVGLVLGFSISFFEALLHLFHIGGDSMVTCISTNHVGRKSLQGDGVTSQTWGSGLSTLWLQIGYCCRPAEVQGDVVPTEPSYLWPTFQSFWTKFGEIFPPVHCIVHGMW